MKMRPITMTKASDGGTVIRLPLGPEGRFVAELDLGDWEVLLSQGAKGNANYIEVGGKKYVTMPSLGQNAMLARLIAKAGKGERVYYRDGNTLNLRSGNLEVRLVRRYSEVPA